MKLGLATLLFLWICIQKSSCALDRDTIDELNEELVHWTAKYPNLARVYTIGHSVQGRPINVLKLGTNSSVEVPNVKIIGTMYGNEPVTLFVTRELAKYLVQQFIAGDTYIKSLLGKVNVHLLPLLNPDGFMVSGRSLGCYKKIGKENANNVDLNRNFPSNCKTHSQSVTGILQPETDAVVNWMKTTHFMLSAALHSGSRRVSYPYACSKGSGFLYYDDMNDFYSRPDDDEEFKYLARKYVEEKGDMNSEPYWVGRYPSSVTMNAAVWHAEALLQFIEESQRGVKGIIFKGKTPIAGANVSISGRDVIQKTTERGEYWRYLLPGTYYIKVEYKNKKVLKIFEVPKQTTLEPVVLNIDIDEEAPKLYTLNEVGSLSDKKTLVVVHLHSSQSSESKSPNKAANLSIKTKIYSIVIFPFMLCVFHFKYSP